MMRQQKGFAALQILLLVLIVAIIGVTGYFVWYSRQTTDQTLSDADKAANSTASQKSGTDSDNPVTSWLLYESPGGEYTVRLADGWQLERYQKSAGIYAFGSDSVVYEKGQKATVTEVQDGKDGPTTGLFVNYFSTPPDSDMQGTKQQGLTTDDGLTVEKYYHVTTGDATDEGLAELQVGSKTYTYAILLGGETRLTIGYTVGPDDVDEHQIVERVVKTLHLN